MGRKAISYVRVSGRGQIGKGGFDRQRDAIAEFAESKRLNLVGEFQDRGVSGKHELADREGLASLLDRVTHNGVRIVLVESADRLARKLATQETILEQFRSAEITVFDSSGNDLTNDSDPTRILIRQVLGAVAQFDRHVTVLKLRAARERVKAIKGRCEGRKPFGFYEGEPEVLREIRRLRRKPRGRDKRRMSWQRIANELNRKGIPSRMGGAWKAATLLLIARRNRIS